jgi:hypothetical protein
MFCAFSIVRMWTNGEIRTQKRIINLCNYQLTKVEQSVKVDQNDTLLYLTGTEFTAELFL